MGLRRPVIGDVVTLAHRARGRAHDTDRGRAQVRGAPPAFDGGRGIAVERDGAGDLAAEVRRLQEENSAMERRMLQARKHISGLMQRLAALEIET